MQETYFYLKDAAEKIGIAPITLKKWLLDGKVPDVKRDRNGWRIFTNQDIERIKKFTDKTTHPQFQLHLPGQNSNNKTSSFRDSAFNGNKKLPFHRWVPWIAGFSADFVEDCFQKYIDNKIPRNEITILDPFAGVGTTLIEGLLHGYNVLGFEINPYAYLACKVKLDAHKLDTKSVLKELNKFEKYYQKRVADRNYAPRTPSPKGFNTRVPFYSPSVERKSLICFDFISNIKDLKIKDLFKLAFGAVMVSFSNYSYEPSLGRRSSSGKPDIKDAPVDEIISKKINEIISDIQEFEELHSETVKSLDTRVFNESIFKALDHCQLGSVDLLVTSPPYLNNYHYLRNTRPQLYWLDLARDKESRHRIEEESFGKFWQTVRDREQIDLNFNLDRLERKLEILRKVNPDKRVYGGAGWANYAATYFNDSFRFCGTISELLKPGGIAVVVIGNSILQSIEIKTDEIFADIGELVGLKKDDIILLRKKRTGSSIIDSDVRVGKTKEKTILYETAVVLRK